MKKLFSVSCLILSLLAANLSVFAAESSSMSEEAVDPAVIYREEQEKSSNLLPYSEIELKSETKSALAQIDGDVVLTLISGERDFADGGYLEYYNGFTSDSNFYYLQLVNTLKTVAEYNDFITLQFIDPYSVYSQEFLKKYKSYELEYGDLFISCYSNFDGNAKTRRTVLKAAELLQIDTVDGVLKVSGIKAEEKITESITEMRNTRDINVAYIVDMCGTSDITYLENYLEGSLYNIADVSFLDEKLGGYDMMLIVSPLRDATLEEIVIIDAFLNNNGEGGKMLAFFSPKEYVALPNLYSFLHKWGITMVDDRRLSATEMSGYFTDSTQLYAKSSGSDFTSLSDSTDGFYIMDKCTPMSVESDESRNLSVTELLHSKTAKLEMIAADSSLEDETAIKQKIDMQKFPLMALAGRNDGESASYVLSCASSDFITTYFALQNDKSQTEYKGELCSNLSMVSEVFDNLNKVHRSEKSGLENYAIDKSEMGIDVTSGLSRKFIMSVAIGGVCLMIIIFIIMLRIGVSKSESN